MLSLLLADFSRNKSERKYVWLEAVVSVYKIKLQNKKVCVERYHILFHVGLLRVYNLLLAFAGVVKTPEVTENPVAKSIQHMETVVCSIKSVDTQQTPVVEKRKGGRPRKTETCALKKQQRRERTLERRKLLEMEMVEYVSHSSQAEQKQDGIQMSVGGRSGEFALRCVALFYCKQKVS